MKEAKKQIKRGRIFQIFNFIACAGFVAAFLIFLPKPFIITKIAVVIVFAILYLKLFVTEQRRIETWRIIRQAEEEKEKYEAKNT